MSLLISKYLGAVPLFLALFGCTGVVNGSEGTSPPSTGLAGSGSQSPVAIPGRVAAGAASLKRLRVEEYTNCIHDLLGDAVRVPKELQQDLARGGFSTISAAVDPYSSDGIEKFEAAASDIAGQVFQNPADAAALVGCVAGDASDACVARFIKEFGRRAWRRPLDASEVQRWVSVVASVSERFGGDVQKGLELALAGLLQSPFFLYRTDIGTPVGDAPDRRRYSPHEMAARLSFTLWSTTPDNELLAAADSGQLATSAGVETQVARLLASERAKPAMQRFFRELLRVEDLTTELHPKDAARYALVSDALYASMQRETELNVADVLETRQSALDLLTSPTTFIDDALASFYGVTKPRGAGFVRVSLPPGRIGYLTSGTFLSITSHAASTSPTRRGVYIMQNLLCRPVPPPPPNVNTMFPEDDGSTTTRQRLEAHRANPTCAACHGLFDPIGVAFEHFDALGAYREQENNLAIDATGQLDGATYDGAVGLAQRLRGSPEVTRCLVSGAYRYNTGHNIVSEAEGEGAVIDGLTKAFTDSGQDYVALLSAIAKSESFHSAVGQY